uniref:Ubiquitin fusion degradation protein 1 homolog n=1 Tax=Strigamia maritima TaxID=126957 RepID=T1IT12_STRMM
MFHEPMRPFNTQYRCYSVSMLPGNERQDVERGGKIIMPPSALDTLTRLNIVYPMLFKLSNKKTNRVTHSGVLEFVADEGKVYLPYWMMRNLLLEEGGFIQVESVSLPIATFSKFQPQAEDFLDITNPKAVLENALRSFACLTTGDIIAIKYNDKIYELCALETQPGKAVSIIECDMNVEFAAPLGYKSPSQESIMDTDMDSSSTSAADVEMDMRSFIPFAGHGNRLDGKKRASDSDNKVLRPLVKRGIPDYDYQVGTLKFIRNLRSTHSIDSEAKDDPFQAFSGQAQSLRSRRP